MSKKDSVARAVFVVALALLAYLVGFTSSHYRWFPHRFLVEALEQAASVGASPEVALAHHVYPARHDLVGVATYRGDERVEPEIATAGDDGVILLTSYWKELDWRPGIRLIDRRGKVLHTWLTDPSEIWPKSPHKDPVAGIFNVASNYVHGTWLFENGDVLFNIEYLGLVRMNPAGEVVWRLDRRTHHSIHRAENGNFWVCGVTWTLDQAEVTRRLTGLTAPLVEQHLFEVSPDGDVVKDINVLDAVFKTDMKTLIWQVGRDFTGDVLHMNDVEELSTAMAAEYPLFEAGDLVVSLRTLDTVMVIDPDTSEIKWSVHEPLIRQHDPDFIGDGWIAVFDNHDDMTMSGEALGGSRLVAFRPHTGEQKLLYPVANTPSKHERRFFTRQGGKAQLLPNGHWLISEAQAGRVFETDPEGRTVWEWCQERHIDPNTVAEVLEGTYYAYPVATVRGWFAR